MRKLGFIFFLPAFSLVATAQVAFKTILKKGPVVAGESFQVQYVLEDIEKSDAFYPPDFGDFRFVSGPYEYEGSVRGEDRSKKLKNIVYTLEAITPGRYRIKGATARIGDHFIKSNDVWLEVINAGEAARRGLSGENPGAPPASFLQPGEDPYEKIRKNLFLKVMVDKKNCFTGEAVTATFKLYSRLMSRSDIVKNPGFYGFTVHDMIGLNDKQSVIETINGKRFDVHTVRKVQLYPLQAGSFTIDPMEVVNEVSFSKSAVNNKTEQEIVEGVFPGNDNMTPVNTEVYKSRMSTPALVITVKPAPAKNKPADFAGATGRFLISSSVSKTGLAKNEEGELLVSVSGKGNFTQLSAPALQWPAGMEGFEPQVKDELANNLSPLTGKRVFRYVFVSAKPGQYILPAISFSFFDPDSNGYKTVSTKKVVVTVSNTEKTPAMILPASPDPVASGRPVLLLLAGLFVFIVAGTWLLWFRKKSRVTASDELQQENTRHSVEEIMHPAWMAIQGDDKLFYATLRDCIWKFFLTHFGLRGSKMSRQDLLAMMRQKRVDEISQQTIMEILQQCETGIFADVKIEIDKKELLAKAKAGLEAVYGL